MKIYQMTATFGKLEHATLTLKPGLNIIHAPNEWGKSTWCAFLVAMLYGLDTRSKSTKNTLADKDRYAPWSGVPMEGRIDLNWQGRDITIERRTARRVPLGEFSAYETKTGITVPELTAANCGQKLLGVEQSVFRRSGFIRHGDLPVTQDEALRRRLNALVTTGDESNAADRLGDSLKELRNRIRYNRTGLLPQAEEERMALQSRLSQLEELESHYSDCMAQYEEIKGSVAQLTNHRQAMEYARSRESTARMAEAEAARDAALLDLQQKEAACQGLPSLEEARQTIASLHKVQEEWMTLQPQINQLPNEPVAPFTPAPFTGMSVEQARKMVIQDAKTYVSAKRTTAAVILILVGVLGLLATGMLIFLKAYLFAVAAASGSMAALIWGVYEKSSMSRLVHQLQQKYGSDDQSRWSLPLTAYEKQYKQYITAAKAYKEASAQIQVRLSALNDRLEALCGEESPNAVLERLNGIIQTREAHLAAQTEAQRAVSHFDALQTAVKPVAPPSQPDTLTHSPEETERLLAEQTAKGQHLQNRLGQYQGQMESLGSRLSLQQQLEQTRMRITRLERTYTAVVIAQETLLQAKEELQRRFAPKITERARQLMSRMTDGRYCALSMDTEFSLRANTAEEDTLRDSLWRSDGTMDQLYLSLRLAVAEELTPGAPLVLDDALVRFDDKRLEAALEILEEIGQSRQIILFTCQGRESALHS